jgi:hypothetical protein
MQTTPKKFLSHEINLLKQFKGVTVEDAQIKKTVLTLTMVGSAALIILSLIVFFVSLTINSSAKEASDLEKQWVKRVSVLSDVEGSALAISKKMEAVKKIKNNADFVKILSTFSGVINDRINIVSFEVNKEGQVAISAEASDSISLVNFFDGIIGRDKDSLKYVELSNLVLTKNRAYRFSMNIKYFINK